MAYASVTHGHQSNLADRFTAIMQPALEGFKNRRRINATIRELSTLDTATLNDLGIDRAGIRAAAHVAVYGN